MQSEIETINTVKPFLRWAGSKRWLLNKDEKIAPSTYKTYIEPFLGSAAVFFSMPDTPFIIADLNNELITCYIAIKANYKEIEELVKIHQSNHSKEYYYKIRAETPIHDQAIAARFLYLNRSCFNGIYRVNRQGKFNVPIGSKYCDFRSNVNFENIAARLKEGKILHQDFEKTINLAQKDDFVFIDPPYTVNHNLNGFLEYNEKIFSWDDKIRLKNSVVAAQARGAKITMTNADHETIRELYAGLCTIETIERSSVIAGKTVNRKKTTEIIMKFGWDE